MRTDTPDGPLLWIMTPSGRRDPASPKDRTTGPGVLSVPAGATREMKFLVPSDGPGYYFVLYEVRRSAADRKAYKEDLRRSGFLGPIGEDILWTASDSFVLRYGPSGLELIR